MSSSANRPICRCVSFGCGEKTVYSRSGKRIKGYEVSPNDFRLHSERDKAESISQTHLDVDSKQYDSAWLSSHPHVHRVPSNKPATSTTGPPARPKPPCVVVETLTLHALEAIRRELIERMVRWRAQPRSQRPVSASATPFPHTAELEWLTNMSRKVEVGQLEDGVHEQVLRQQLSTMFTAEIDYLTVRKHDWDGQPGVRAPAGDLRVICLDTVHLHSVRKLPEFLFLAGPCLQSPQSLFSYWLSKRSIMCHAAVWISFWPF